MKNYLWLATVLTGCLVPMLAVLAAWVKRTEQREEMPLPRSWRLGLLDVATGEYRKKDFYAALVLGRGNGPEPDGVLFLARDYTVSRQQCRLSAVGDSVWIENLSQVNETVLNGVPLAVPRELHRGDSILMGRREFQVTFLERR